MIEKNISYHYVISIILIVVMLITRFSHFGSAIALPDASLAVFFLSGLLGNGFGIIGILIIEAVLIDYIAINYFGVPDFCISPAYNFLILGYAAISGIGWFSRRFLLLGFDDTLKMFLAAIVAASTAYFISNGSFYLLSGKFGVLSWDGYAQQFCRYYSMYVSSTLIYIMGALAVIKLSYLVRSQVTARS
jgi:hypothetical protein